MLGIGPRELMRKDEADYRELGLDDQQLDRRRADRRQCMRIRG